MNDDDLWKKGWLDEELARIREETEDWPQEFHRAVEQLRREAYEAAQLERELYGKRRPKVTETKQDFVNILKEIDAKVLGAYRLLQEANKLADRAFGEALAWHDPACVRHAEGEVLSTLKKLRTWISTIEGNWFRYYVDGGVDGGGEDAKRTGAE